MQTLYVLVVDKSWAKLYRTDESSLHLTLTYHLALFGGRMADDSADEELARSLCRLLRADRLSGKFDRLVMLASPNMLAALRRQYDGDWDKVLPVRIEVLPPRYSGDDIELHVRHLLRDRLESTRERALPALASG
jgi:hypothetical protein